MSGRVQLDEWNEAQLHDDGSLTLLGYARANCLSPAAVASLREMLGVDLTDSSAHECGWNDAIEAAAKVCEATAIVPSRRDCCNAEETLKAAAEAIRALSQRQDPAPGEAGKEEP